MVESGSKTEYEYPDPPPFVTAPGSAAPGLPSFGRMGSLRHDHGALPQSNMQSGMQSNFGGYRPPSEFGGSQSQSPQFLVPRTSRGSNLSVPGLAMTGLTSTPKLNIQAKKPALTNNRIADSKNTDSSDIPRLTVDKDDMHTTLMQLQVLSYLQQGYTPEEVDEKMETIRASAANTTASIYESNAFFRTSMGDMESTWAKFGSNLAGSILGSPKDAKSPISRSSMSMGNLSSLTNANDPTIVGGSSPKSILKGAEEKPPRTSVHAGKKWFDRKSTVEISELKDEEEGGIFKGIKNIMQGIGMSNQSPELKTNAGGVQIGKLPLSPITQNTPNIDDDGGTSAYTGEDTHSSRTNSPRESVGQTGKRDQFAKRVSVSFRSLRAAEPIKEEPDDYKDDRSSREIAETVRTELNRTSNNTVQINHHAHRLPGPHMGHHFLGKPISKSNPSSPMSSPRGFNTKASPSQESPTGAGALERAATSEMDDGTDTQSQETASPNRDKFDYDPMKRTIPTKQFKELAHFGSFVDTGEDLHPTHRKVQSMVLNNIMKTISPKRSATVVEGPTWTKKTVSSNQNEPPGKLVKLPVTLLQKGSVGSPVVSSGRSTVKSPTTWQREDQVTGAMVGNSTSVGQQVLSAAIQQAEQLLTPREVLAMVKELLGLSQGAEEASSASTQPSTTQIPAAQVKHVSPPVYYIDPPEAPTQCATLPQAPTQYTAPQKTAVQRPVTQNAFTQSAALEQSSIPNALTQQSYLQQEAPQKTLIQQTAFQGAATQQTALQPESAGSVQPVDAPVKSSVVNSGAKTPESFPTSPMDQRAAQAKPGQVKSSGHLAPPAYGSGQTSSTGQIGSPAKVESSTTTPSKVKSTANRQGSGTPAAFHDKVKAPANSGSSKMTSSALGVTPGVERVEATEDNHNSREAPSPCCPFSRSKVGNHKHSATQPGDTTYGVLDCFSLSPREETPGSVVGMQDGKNKTETAEDIVYPASATIQSPNRAEDSEKKSNAAYFLKKRSPTAVEKSMARSPTQKSCLDSIEEEPCWSGSSRNSSEEERNASIFHPCLPLSPRVSSPRVSRDGSSPPGFSPKGSSPGCRKGFHNAISSTNCKYSEWVSSSSSWKPNETTRSDTQCLDLSYDENGVVRGTKSAMDGRTSASQRTPPPNDCFDFLTGE